MKTRYGSHHHTSHPTHKQWDQVPHTENDDVSNEEVEKMKKLIKGLPRPSEARSSNNRDQIASKTGGPNLKDYSRGYQEFAHEAAGIKANRHFTKNEEFLIKEAFLDSKERGVSKTDLDDFHEHIRFLEKLNAKILLGKREYVTKGEDKFEQIEYPSHNSFKQVSTEAKGQAKQKQDEYVALITNMQLSMQQGIERMNSALTATEEFKSIKSLVEQGNLKEDREELSNFLDSLKPYLQDHSSSATSQKEQIRGYLKKNRWIVAKQISKANQRFKEAEDYSKIAEEGLKNYSKIVTNHEKPVIYDTYTQAKKRAEQTRERAKNAEGQSKEAEERAKQATKRVEEAKKLGSEAAIKAAEQSLHCAKEVASLAQKLAEDEHKLAKSLDEWANKLKSNALSHNSEEEIKILEKEKKAIDEEKKAIGDIKFKQEKEKTVLEAEKEVLEKETDTLKSSKIENRTPQSQDGNTHFLSESQRKRIGKAKGILSNIRSESGNDSFIINAAENQINKEIESIIADAVKKPEEVAIENSVFSREKDREKLDSINSLITHIDKAVETIGKSSETYDKQDEIYSKIDIYHKSLDSSHSTIDQTNEYEKYAVQFEQAKIRSEQYEIRKKQAEDRYEQYNKRKIQLTDQHIDSKAVQQAALHAKEIIQYEHSLQNAEYSIAMYAEQAAENIKKVESIKSKITEIESENKDKNKLSDSEKSLAEAEKSRNDAQDNLTKWIKERDELLKTPIAHKKGLSAKELVSIENDHNIAKKTFDAAKEDLETLVNLRKHLDTQEVSSNASNDLIKRSYKSLARNLRYMEYKSNADQKKAIEMINTIDINSINNYAQDIINGSEAHIPICNSRDGEKWLFVHGVVVNIRELRNIKIDAETKQTQIQWREDIPRLSIFGSRKFSKRISSFHLDTDNKTLTFEAPGTHYKRGPGENERSVWKVIKNGEEKVYDAETLDGIEVKLHHHEEGKDEVSIQTTIKTMPKGAINHDALFNGYSRLHLQTMNRINAKSGEFIGQNNKFRKKMFHFDFTETTNAPGVGLLLHEDATNRSTHPDSIVKADRLLESANKVEEKTKAEIMEYDKYSKMLLKEAFESQSRDRIQQVIRFLEQNDALAASETAAMNYRLQNAPKDIDEVMELKSTSKSYFKRLSDRHSQNAQEIFQAKNIFNDRLKKIIVNLHENKSSEVVKEQVLKAIHAVYRVKDHNFQLLVDPNKDGAVKCSHPNSLMLVEEWEMYANKDLSEQEKIYKERIENFILSNCDTYWKNHISIMKAANYAVKGDVGLNDAIASLKGLSLEDSPLDPSDLAALGSRGKAAFDLLDTRRGHDEGELVHYLNKAFSHARAEGVDQLLYGYLSIAKHMQQSKLDTLRLAKYALNPDTSPENAIKAIKDIPVDKLPSAMTVNETEQNNKNIEEYRRRMKTLLDNDLDKVNPAQIADSVTKLAWKTASEEYQCLLDSTHDPIRKKELEADPFQKIAKIAETHQKIYEIAMRVVLFNKTQKQWIIMLILDTLTAMNNGLNQIGGRVNGLSMNLMAFTR